MIAALSGSVAESRADGLLLLRCGPVTMELHMPISQAVQFGAGDPAELFTYLHFSSTADQLRLFAFSTAVSRDLFTRLISGSGIGPRVALGLLDLGVGRLVSAIRDGDEAALTRVSGVGPKLAKKILAELSDRIAKEFGGLAGQQDGAAPPAARTALEAVVGLGWPRGDVEAALNAVRKSYEGQDSTELIRLLLRQLSAG